MKDVMYRRRSIRRYTEEPVSREQIEESLEAGLLAPTGRNLYPWQFVVVDDREALQELGRSKAGGSAFLADAALAIVVVADEEVTDVWVEDASIAATFMMLQAQSLGLGNCWVQSRLRFADKDGTLSSETVVRRALGIPENLRVDCILSIGHPGEDRPAKTPDDLQWDKVHLNQFGRTWKGED